MPRSNRMSERSRGVTCSRQAKSGTMFCNQSKSVLCCRAQEEPVVTTTTTTKGNPLPRENENPYARKRQEKKVTRAAAIQKSQNFSDAWAEQNAGRPDVWLFIGLLTLLTPVVILIWGVAWGVIPLG